MKFTKKKFQSLNPKTQKNKIAKLIEEIYKIWENEEKRNMALYELKKLLIWNGEADTTELVNYLTEGCIVSDLATFDKYATPYLMKIKHNLKDDLIIYSNDYGRQKSEIPLFLILDNLRSLYNVGAIFRSAECFGVRKIFLIGYTPSPEHIGFEKTAMGAGKMVAWEKFDTIEPLLEKLKTKNTDIYALELTSKSLDINYFEPNFPSAIILGNEALGISKNTLNFADKILYIPLYGNKNSLNVASASAIALNIFANNYWKRKL